MGQQETKPAKSTKSARNSEPLVPEWHYRVSALCVERGLYQVEGSLAPGLEYKIKYSTVHPSSMRATTMETFDTLVAVPKRPQPKARDKLKTKRVFSSGVTFYYQAHVKRIPCDQLKSMPRHKERCVKDSERRNAVVRKLHHMGGWLRSGNAKDRYYVEPLTPVPARFAAPKKQELDFI